MGLRLRRGTNANRLLFTPTEGELIYVTDYQTAGVSALYVGDGVTLGGNPVDTDTDTQLALNNFSITDLGDVNVGIDSTVPQDGDFLAYNADAGDWDPRTPTMQALGDYNASGITDGEFLRYNAAGNDFRNVTLSTGLLEDINYSIPPTGGQVLKYNAVDGNWAPADDTDTTLLLSGQSIGDLGDVNITHDSSQPTHGDTLIWDSVDNEFKSQPSIQSINQLDDVSIDGIQVNDYLVWTGTRFDAIPNPLYAAGPLEKSTVGTHTGAVNGTTVSASAGFTGNLTGNAAGDHTGTFTGSSFGTFEGDVNGSVFSNDSTAMIDGVASEVVGDVNNQATTSRVVSVNDITAIDDARGVRMTAVDDANRFTLMRVSANPIGATDALGRILFAKNEADVITVQGSLAGTEAQLTYIPSPGGTPNYNNYFKVHNTGKVAINMGSGQISAEPAAALEVGGAIKPGVYADAAARDAAITSPVAGMIVFVTDVTQFQGYTGSAWVALN